MSPLPEDAHPPARYRFGPLEHRGVIAGLGGGQVSCVAATLALAVLLLRLVPAPGNLAAGTGVVASGLGAAFVPLGGRTAEEWAPVLLRWAAETLRGRRRWYSGAHLVGAGGPGPPPEMVGCEVIAHSGAAVGSKLGVLVDRRRGTYAAVLAVTGGGFALLDAQAKERRLAAWSSVLAGLAREGSVVHRVQWVERARPGDSSGLEMSMAERLDARAPGEAARSYAELVSDAGPVTPHHETLLAVSVCPTRIRRQVRAAGGGTDGVLELLSRELVLLESNLRSAEIQVEGALGPVALRGILASGFTGGLGHWRAPWPVAVESHWGALRTDGCWHATYWVAEWPRSDVGPDFLVPLLLLASGVRAVAVTMEPIGPRRAAREVEAARTAGAADEELRRRGGFMATARRQRQAEGTARRETEMADGHADYRFSGYVTVSGDSPAGLERACSEVEHGAAQARLELRRLYGQQDQAFTYTLPTTRGLR